MRYFALIIDLSPTAYTIQTVPTLAVRLTLWLQILTIISQTLAYAFNPFALLKPIFNQGRKLSYTLRETVQETLSKMVLKMVDPLIPRHFGALA